MIFHYPQNSLDNGSKNEIFDEFAIILDSTTTIMCGILL